MSNSKRVLLLGFDGQDPRITERLMQGGKLPNFARLAQTGGYAPLATTNPAQSPVAWTTLATGVGPGVHGVFDFLRPMPERMLVDLAIQDMRPNPGGPPTFHKVRAAKAFWEITSEAGLHTSILRWPVTFPAEKVTGDFISGLGAPDIKGRLGSYTYYTTSPAAPDDKAPEKVASLKAAGGGFAGELLGPMVAGLLGAKPAKLPFTIRPVGPGAAELEIGGQRISLRVDEWSPWVQVRFSVGGRREAPGILKFLLLELGEVCRLYAAPIEVDPADPCYPVAAPASYAQGLVERHGLFHTLGMPEDTKGVTDRRFGPERFLETCEEVTGERECMLRDALAKMPEESVTACVFDTSDRIQHLFWASEDLGHPLSDDSWRAHWGHVIEDSYIRQDAILGEALDAVGDSALVLVFSDHGFSTYRRSVHLNRWLAENGYMEAALDTDDNKSTLFRAVDWSKTRAYACGFACIYLNLQGREAKGIVAPGEEAARLRAEIAGKLQGLPDTEKGCRAVRQAFERDEVFRGPLVKRAPDVVVGFEPGYRASWQTAIGGGLRCLIEDNLEPWSGDHLIHPDCVPGVVFANAPLVAERPTVRDLAGTVLAAVGLEEKLKTEGNRLV